MSLFIANDLTCVRNQKILFKNLTFSLEDGQCLQITGENGSGKSTLLKTLVGLIPLEKGEILFEHHSIANNFEAYAQKIFYLGHQRAVKDELTVLENLEFFIQLFCLKKSSLEISSVMKKLNLEHLASHLCIHLSQGQKQRVALAKCFLSNAKLLFLDEPFTALDEKGVKVFMQFLSEKIAMGLSIILTSHHVLEFGFPVKKLCL